jgi:hypothetical protein
MVLGAVPFDLSVAATDWSPLFGFASLRSAQLNVG